MITLALAQMIFFYFLQAPFTGGEDGIQAVPRGTLLGLLDLSNVWAMYGTVFVIFMAGFLLLYLGVHSPFGPGLEASPGEEEGAPSPGYRVTRHKSPPSLLLAARAPPR